MARAGGEIYNTVQQDRVIWRKTARDTDGELLSADHFVSPGGGDPMHVHPRQEARFQAVSGSLGVPNLLQQAAGGAVPAGSLLTVSVLLIGRARRRNKG